MFIIAGLGNPGREYVNTRHNIGFEAIDVLASKYNIKFNKEKFKGLFGEGYIAGEKVILVKPQTYMNLSGECIREFVNWYKIDSENLIVIFDDVSLPLGRMRIRPKGSDGGHNGVKNIIYQLASDVFPRIKIGIGAPINADYDLASFVLGKFSKEEIKILTDTVIKAADAAETIMKSGVQEAMAKFNGK